MKYSSFIAAVICSVAVLALPATAATIQFGDTDYDVNPGDSVTVQVQFNVPATIDVLAASAKVCIFGGDVPGEVTTSVPDVVQAATGTYIIDNSSGFFAAGTTALCAVGGDATFGVEETKTPGVYSFMDITWAASATALGDYLIQFEDVGLGINGLTYLADDMGQDYLTGSRGATIHVIPEPASLLLLGISGLFAFARRRR